MLTLTTPPRPSFVYRKTKPFTKAEFKFRTALADYANKRLLACLQGRTLGAAAVNRYSGINARITSNTVYLEAILVNDVEWGGFGFEFARLIPANSGLYNLSIRRHEDWLRAENSTIAAASTYFLNVSLFPRASDWILFTRGKTFEQCVDVLEKHLSPNGSPHRELEPLL